MISRLPSVLLLAMLSTPAIPGQASDAYVRPLIGTANAGQTYPSTGVPFAMTNWTPQTCTGEVKCFAPYYFADKRIQGFRGSHFLSASCVPDYGSMTVAAIVGELKTSAVARSSSFDRSAEHATPAVYSVCLPERGIRAKEARAALTTAHGSITEWKKGASPSTSGIATGIPSAPSWQWPGQASKKFSRRRDTRQSRCRRDIVTSRQLIGCRLRSALHRVRKSSFWAETFPG